jgi:hypothetical protein
MIRIKEMAGLTLFAASLQFASTQQVGYRTNATIHLSNGLDGFDGRLELLEDDRLTPELDKLLWMSGGPEMALDSKDPRYVALTSAPLRPALINLVDAHSNKVASRKLEREGAHIKTVSLIPGHRVVFVTTDLSAGFGSYSGPFTQLIDVSRGRLDVLEARNSQSGKLEPIALADTLKTAWKLVAIGPTPGGSTDILEFACRPKQDASVFYLIYTRYHWNGKEWIEFRRQTKGFWEADQAFPSPAEFPGRE